MRAEGEAVKTKGGKRSSAVQWNGRVREHAQKGLKKVQCQDETRKGSVGRWVGAVPCFLKGVLLCCWYPVSFPWAPTLNSSSTL